MVPASFTAYFSANAAGAGVLIGLLFVAVALRPETIFGDDARIRLGSDTVGSGAVDGD